MKTHWVSQAQQKQIYMLGQITLSLWVEIRSMEKCRLSDIKRAARVGMKSRNKEDSTNDSMKKKTCCATVEDSNESFKPN